MRTLTCYACNGDRFDKRGLLCETCLGVGTIAEISPKQERFLIRFRKWVRKATRFVRMVRVVFVWVALAFLGIAAFVMGWRHGR